MSVEIDGVIETLKNLGATEEEIRKALAAALYQEGFALIADSIREVPVDFGRLRGSHYVAPPAGETNPEVEVGYGTDYAAYVHERTELNHPVGKAKFLEDPMKRRQAGYSRRVADRTKTNWERGVGVSAIGATVPTEPNE